MMLKDLPSQFTTATLARLPTRIRMAIAADRPGDGAACGVRPSESTTIWVSGAKNVPTTASTRG
jgi:hypothetical protein